MPRLTTYNIDLSSKALGPDSPYCTARWEKSRRNTATVCRRAGITSSRKHEKLRSVERPTPPKAAKIIGCQGSPVLIPGTGPRVNKLRAKTRAFNTGERHEHRPSPGRHEKRRIHTDVRRQAAEVGRQRPALHGLGDFPHERIARRSQSHLRLPVERLVRADH